MSSKQKMTTQQLTEKLAKKYPSPAFCFVTEVRNSTGFVKTPRTADAMAMGTWPSRGLDLTGFELKVSRSDWLNELKNPHKAQEMLQFCDYWYLVVPEEKIVEPGELPTQWGLMVANGRGGSIKVHKEAPKLDPIEPDRVLLASLFRHFTEKMIDRSLIKTKLDEAKEQGRLDADWENKHAKQELEALKEKISTFEKASGVKVEEDWKHDAGEIGLAVKMVLTGRHHKAKEEIRHLRKQAQDIIKYLDGKIEEFQIGSKL